MHTLLIVTCVVSLVTCFAMIIRKCISASTKAPEPDTVINNAPVEETVDLLGEVVIPAGETKQNKLSPPWTSEKN